MTKEDVYESFAEHLSHLVMGFPYRDTLVEILKENFSPLEAEVARALPTGVSPMRPTRVDDILSKVDLSRDALLETLEGLANRGLLYSTDTENGEKGYALLQVGFGFPQTFFWKGENTPHARKMAGLASKYFNRHVTKEAFSPTDTKAYRYIPMGQTIETQKQGVFSHHMMEDVIEKAEIIAVAHCPCRVAYSIRGAGCHHSTDVCLKFNAMARFVIEKDLAREISKEEAHAIIKRSEEEGLVHFVDNAEGDILHNCNCCGCACWNVGSIRRRKIPRDMIMATYFLRETNEENCIGCGSCVDICPVDAITMQDDAPVVDKEWCIGCGVCASVCNSDAIKVKLRPDRTEQLPASSARDLHDIIREEKGLG